MENQVAAVSEIFLPEASAPVPPGERITALDTLRGFALLGILLMNIVMFGMHGAAYNDVTVTGGSTGANLAIWTVLHTVAEGKMRCLFSLVFGAGVILLTSRLEETGRESADIYYRRTLWLLLFGILDAYLLWVGDILYPYALCALILFPFRHMPGPRLLRIGSVLLVVMAVSYIGLGFKQRDMLAEGPKAIAAEKRGEKLSDKQREFKESYENWRKANRPNAEELKKDREGWTGSPLKVLETRAGHVASWHSKPYYHPINWDIWSMMFIGMGLMKSGVLTAARSTRYYWTLAAIGYAIGLPVNSYTAWVVIKSNFDPVTQAFAGSLYDVGRLSIALGHLGLVMAVSKAGWLGWLTSRLGAVGQMAFTNYVMHSVICTVIFTGFGFKLYGSLERYQLYYVVAGIWVFQLIVSPIWLRHYRFGPLEWVWRSLTYWRRQPMRLAA
jgi:uncharacterized protein